MTVDAQTIPEPRVASGLTVCRVMGGALTEVPIFNGHHRAKNWMARIYANPMAGPGGLGRIFQDRARGEFIYEVSGIRVGMPVEFGADYYTGVGRKKPERWYAVVEDLTDRALILRQYETAIEALEASTVSCEPPPPPPPPPPLPKQPPVLTSFKGLAVDQRLEAYTQGQWMPCKVEGLQRNQVRVLLDGEAQTVLAVRRVHELRLPPPAPAPKPAQLAPASSSEATGEPSAESPALPVQETPAAAPPRPQRSTDELLQELRRIAVRLEVGEEYQTDPDTFVTRFKELDQQLMAGEPFPQVWAEVPAMKLRRKDKTP